MPSTTSSSLFRPLPSSTVITPSLPTLSIASAMILPIASSAFAEMEPTWAISLLVVQGLEIFFSSATTAMTALSMPRFKSIGFIPAATYFVPSRTIAWASTVAVVVPSPATSEVLEATSLTICAPMFSNLSFSSISLATDTPSLVMVGAPYERSSTTLRPFGPSVTLTASARMLTPATILLRAASWNFTSLAAIFYLLKFGNEVGCDKISLTLTPSRLRVRGQTSSDEGLSDSAYASTTPMMSSSRMVKYSWPSILKACPEYLPNNTRSPTLTDIACNLPSSPVLPLPTAMISP